MNIPGYAFVNTNSKTQAGGVGLYLSNDLKFSRRSDLDISDDGIESCWIELARTAQKNVVIRGQEVLVLGDFNENLLKYNEDKQTSEYLDMLLSLGFMPIITIANQPE